jgi:ubiquinone/menaquinone biosynthesis C-methylase UbiE
MDWNGEIYGHVQAPQKTVAPAAAVAVPDYLRRVYWWTYIHPFAVWFFDRLWLVNLIVLTNYHRLREAALAEFAVRPGERVLQISCAYGNVTPKLAECVAAGGGRLDVIDVLPIQLKNLKRKLPAGAPVRTLNMDSTGLGFAAAAYDRALLFLLLHEQPVEVKRRTLAEALRVLKPGGKLVIVDFARPYWWNPFRYLWAVFLSIFEPFALDMWWHEVGDFLPPEARGYLLRQQRLFGGLFQKITLTRP